MKKISAMLLAMFAGAAVAGGNGFYIEGGIGQSKADLPSIAGVNLDDTDTSYSFGAGYNFNKYIAAEAGYQYLGEASYSASGGISGTYNGQAYTLNGSARLAAEDTYGFYIGPKFTLPINEQFELNARGGIFMWNSTVKASASLGGTYGSQIIAASASASEKVDGTDYYYGVGANYNINKNVAFGLDYTRFKVDSYDVDTWALKAKYSF